jgi:hypothetical protein
MQDAYTPHAMDRLRLGQMTRERPMPNTGLFHVLELDAVSGVQVLSASGPFACAATPAAGLHSCRGRVGGGARWNDAGVRRLSFAQTVSNARLVECDHVLPGSAQGSDA